MRRVLLILVAGVWASTGYGAVGAFPVEDGFLNINLDQLTEKKTVDDGIDLSYEAPELLQRLTTYDKVIIDQPEVFLSKDSEYRGMKPDNAAVIVDMIRQRVVENVQSRGRYEVVEEPGPDVLHLRIALTDLYLKKKKRNLLTYTPVGAVAHAGVGLVQDMMSKVDIIEMALQAELSDSETGEVLAAAVIKRGARKDKETGQKMQRMDFDEFRAVLQQYGATFACRLDNVGLSEADQVDCVALVESQLAESE